MYAPLTEAPRYKKVLRISKDYVGGRIPSQKFESSDSNSNSSNAKNSNIKNSKPNNSNVKYSYSRTVQSIKGKPNNSDYY